MVRKISFLLVLCLFLQIGCDAKKSIDASSSQNETQTKDGVTLVENAFAEGKALVCPEGSNKIEKTDSSYPSYYCIGKNGKTGAWLEYDKYGRLSKRLNYVDDKLEGAWITYHANGTIDTKGEMANNGRTGEWTQWYIDGKKRSVKHYKDNIIHGHVELYYRSGGLMADGDYVDNFEEGPWKVYTPEGKVARECRMEHGDEYDCVVYEKDFEITTRKFGEGKKIRITEDNISEVE